MTYKTYSTDLDLPAVLRSGAHRPAVLTLYQEFFLFASPIFLLSLSTTIVSFAAYALSWLAQDSIINLCITPIGI